MSKTMLLKSRISEKAYALSDQGVYVFDVPEDANKQEIGRAVQAQFKVTVLTVNVGRVKGKSTRSVRRGKAIPGKRNDIKKAYVTLKEGDSIPVFAALKEEEKKSAAKETKK